MSSAHKILVTLVFAFLFIGKLQAQDKLVLDYNHLMEIPDVVAMQASTSHLYILSQTDGMAVFRVYPDSLDWLYTSSGMQRRGNRMIADTRFAYLFGKSRRLTVLEPTSALGVYSSAILPAPPASVARINTQLYIALGDKGLGYLSLESPESVDSEIQYASHPALQNNRVLDVASSKISNQLFVLLDNSSLLVYESENGTLETPQTVSLSQPFQHIFIVNERILGSTATGEIFEVGENGLNQSMGSVEEEVTKVMEWQDIIFVRTNSGKVWTTFESDVLTPWKSDQQSGNYITTANGQAWLAENNKVANIKRATVSANNASVTGPFRIKDIKNQVIAFPQPLVMALELENNYPPGDVTFSYRSGIKNAEIRQQGFYWQPTSSQIGMHWFNIVATNASGNSDSTRFMVDVRSFNTPPRFAPVRGTAIATNELYTLQFKAIDPENPSGQLIRYIGVDMPEGASINEKTGEFKWTPSQRQVGETTFKVIATDRHGAASSIDITLKVLDISRGQSQ
ncbi:MAG: cadherin repeat domain-containing protein [Balneolaceae bacterium]|nr:cadherin repeat domain-containing protein [Balneolaceae bacterium]